MPATLPAWLAEWYPGPSATESEWAYARYHHLDLAGAADEDLEQELVLARVAAYFAGPGSWYAGRVAAILQALEAGR